MTGFDPDEDAYFAKMARIGMLRQACVPDREHSQNLEFRCDGDIRLLLLGEVDDVVVVRDEADRDNPFTMSREDWLKLPIAFGS